MTDDQHTVFCSTGYRDGWCDACLGTVIVPAEPKGNFVAWLQSLVPIVEPEEVEYRRQAAKKLVEKIRRDMAFFDRFGRHR